MSVSNPLVSVICICHNHQKFVAQAIDSVEQQHYKPIQLIVIDDASRDGSFELIRSLLEKKTDVKLLHNDQSLGNCVSFNRALEHVKGQYVIDLAADDILLPERIQIGVEALNSFGSKYGVHYCDVQLIDEKNGLLELYSKKLRGIHGESFTSPEGDVYRSLIEKYFISAPAMMMRTSMIRDLEGYDENLSYEDFDFWIRSSRDWQYCYTDQPLVKKRIVKRSLSTKQYRFGSEHDRATFEVCKKIHGLNRDLGEFAALQRRVLYEFKKSLASFNLRLAFDYAKLYQQCARAIRQA